MIIGIPREIKDEEDRVGLTPYNAHELINHGHRVVVEHNAGLEIGFDDEAYQAAGIEVLGSAKAVYAEAELIIKVKEPQSSEYHLLHEGQILFAYLHLAADSKQTHALLESGCIALAYETVTGDEHRLPLLAPMSQIAGRLAIQEGAHYLQKSQGGSGLLLGGIPGVYSGCVVVIGGGMVGSNAIRMALGKEAKVTVLDKSLQRLQSLDLQFEGRLETAYATTANIASHVSEADLVVGAVLVPGEVAPKVVTRQMVASMRPGSVVVDVAIDQGGCVETSHPTSHSHPTFVSEAVVHYCVTNMPGAVPRTSTLALNNVTLPYILSIADKGYRKALLGDPHLLNGLNIFKGKLTYPGVAKDLGMNYVSARDALLSET